VFDKIIHDTGIRGTFNLAPYSFSSLRNLAPRKIFVPVPLFIARASCALLWRLHLSSIMPSALTVSTYRIIVNPEKIMKRLGYRFRYSTREAFFDTVKKRKKSGTLR
jgi:hypothetical protein